METNVNGRRAKRASIEATIIRADGTIEHLGIIQYDHRNPIIRIVGRTWYALQRRLGHQAISASHRAEVERAWRAKRDAT